MTFKNLREDDKLTYFLSERLDADTAPALEEELESLPDDIKTLVFDLDDLTYIASSGLRAFLTAQKIMNSREGSMKLINVADNIALVLKATGFNMVIQIE